MRPQTHGHNSVKSQLIYNFFTRRFLSKFAVNWLLKIRPLLARVTTLPWETLMSETERLTPGSVATYGVAGHITKLRKVYCRVWQWKTFFNRWIFGKVTSKNVVVPCTFFVFSSAMARPRNHRAEFFCSQAVGLNQPIFFGSAAVQAAENR